MKSGIVVTTINNPTEAMIAIRNGAAPLRRPFIVVGDSKGPEAFDLEPASFFSLEAQRKTGFRYAEACPEKHYARKNIGYLIAMQEGCDIIQETDDDNIPRKGFFDNRTRSFDGKFVGRKGWCNVYRYFSQENIWPRGLPLSEIQQDVPLFSTLPKAKHDCPIQQGLADENPDVDAIYRLTSKLPIDFALNDDVALDNGVWCPFNSQNTTWWQDAFILLYLPFHCSFRMTDIWRSFVAQRLAWECGWKLLFHHSTVFQKRNEHDLMRDFADEIPGYLNNERIRKTLEDLPLLSGKHSLPDNIRIAYEALIALGVVGQAEEALLSHWLHDIHETLGKRT